ncbi:hypothetical protein [Paenibacillus apiarius]|nr:hypothetical protein [Paenibacillus apiarius]MBN3526774.1 hypothetical protein [Paenibacillus apiarius]
MPPLHVPQDDVRDSRLGVNQAGSYGPPDPTMNSFAKSRLQANRKPV